MGGKIIGWIFFIMMASFLFLQCKNKPEKTTASQPPVVKTDDSIVFRELGKNGFYHRADSFYKEDMNDSAVHYYNKALIEPSLSKDGKLKQEILNRIGYTYVRLSDYKKSKLFLTKALLLINKNKLDLIDANTFDYLGLLNHFQNESDSALFYLNKAYKVYFRILGDRSLQIVKLNTQLGDVYRWIRFDYYNAEKYYYKALQIFESQGFDKKNDQYFRILYFLASTNKLKNDFNKSLYYGLQALHLAGSVEKLQKYLEICYGLVANIYLMLKDYRSSIDYYDKALEINSGTSKTNDRYRPLYYDNLAYANNRLANYTEAISYCKQALKIFDKVNPDYNGISSCYEYLGLSYQGLHQWSKAYENLRKCVELRSNYLGLKHPNTADAYNLMGRYYDDRQNNDSALYYYQLAIISGSIGFNNIDINAVPLFSQSMTNINLIDYLAFKASTLKKKYIHNPNDTLCLIASLKCYDLLDSLASFSRKRMDTEGSKLSFSSDRNELYEGAIDDVYLLFELKKNSKYINKAFRFFEKNKYLLLLEKLKMAEAASKAGVPNSLVESERNLNSELTFVQDKLTEEQGKKNVNALQVQSLNARMFTLVREMEKLHGVFEQRYPHYFEIKYHDVNLTLNDLQQYSRQKEVAVIQYFWGEKFVHVIGTIGSRLNFFRINNTPEFKDSLAILTGMMHEVNLTSGDKFRDYVRKAHHFYNLLVKPALAGANFQRQSLRSVTIIPDGPLSRLSFEALVTDLPTPLRFSYKSLSYLINQYDLAYAYSTNILLSNPQSTTRRSNAIKLLGFGYSGNNKINHKQITYNELPGTCEEMKAISACFRSHIFMGQNATEHNFKKWVQDYDIIHLALHGSADEEKSGSKFLFRTEKETTEDGMLFANEIYNLNLKAKLVVLSACETGLGKDYQGEGVFSMARAFAYAGCPSMVMSLWKVNDHSTASQMGRFYKHLSEGKPVSQSLRLAKLEYLQNADEIAAQPVFWASFVALGDMSPVKQESNYLIWMILIIVVVGSFLLYFLIIKIKRRDFFRVYR